MTAWQYLMLGVAVSSGLAWRWNATCPILAFGYFVGQVWYLVDPKPLGEAVGQMLMVDVMVIALIFCKAVSRCPEQVFRNGLEQLWSFIAAPTWHDRLVLAIFPFMWIVYVLAISDFTRWWALYALAMAQFLTAGSEAASEWRKANAPAGEQEPPSPGSFRTALAGAGQWST